MNEKNITKTSIIIGIVIAAFCLITSYNSFVSAKADVDLAQSNIEAAMQARIEKIPDLVATAKAYTDHGERMYEELTQAREALAKSIESGNLQQIDVADRELTVKINNIISLVEDNPEFDAGEQYTALMDSIEGAVNRITQARREYNKAVNAYNKKIDAFPGNVYAKLFGFEKQEEFKADENAHRTSVVDFGNWFLF